MGDYIGDDGDHVPPSAMYEYDELPETTAFRVMELLPENNTNPPGRSGASLACRLHIAQWSGIPDYEAISYVWGTSEEMDTIFCDGALLQVTKSLHTALKHMRLPDRPRFLWADAVCINQQNRLERGRQVKQMQKIYQSATGLLVWLGPDNEEEIAGKAVRAVNEVSDFICDKVGVPVESLSQYGDIYQEVLFANKHLLPTLDQTHLVDRGNFGDGNGDTSLWKLLLWVYSHSYFTRVWVIQEVNANDTNRTVYCGNQTIEWHRVEIVAGYIILETAFSRKYGFTKAYCWWAAIVATDRIRRPKNWLSTLYLASSFSSTDLRDAVYGLLGLIEVKGDSGLQEVSYDKPVALVYVDTVEAALVHFQNTDVLLYATTDANDNHGSDTEGQTAVGQNYSHDWVLPSWAPEWNKAMLFRNPFRFGKSLPWQPAGERQFDPDAPPVWAIDRDARTLTLRGLVFDTIELTANYNESCFGNSTLDSDDKRRVVAKKWIGILRILLAAQERRGREDPIVDMPHGLSLDVLRAAAVSLSYGLDGTSTPVDDEEQLLLDFIAYLKIILDDTLFSAYIPYSVALPSSTGDKTTGDGRAFGKPVWDFSYPESSLFVTKRGLVGCCITTTQPGDIVFAPLGGTYPSVLRPEEKEVVIGENRRDDVEDGEDKVHEVRCRIRGFSFVHGVMRGERMHDARVDVCIS
ncbi:hypothetical protein SEUCBS139899_006921 [Sporothrix eucalyptigena]